MFNEIVSIVLGLFVGLYASFVGTTGGSAIMIYLLLILNIIPSQTVIAGTMLFVSSIPLGLFGLYDYYKNKKIDYYIGTWIILGLTSGLLFGSKYVFVLNNLIGEKSADKIKFGMTALVYAVLSGLYVRQALKA